MKNKRDHVYFTYTQFNIINNICTPGIYLKFMIGNLEHDLLDSQAKIISLLTEYQKSSEQIIKSNYTVELHNLLDSIASFDHQKIRQCENIIKDKTALQYLDSIANKIRNVGQTKPKQENTDTTKVEKPQKIQEKDKPEIKQNGTKKQGGIFDFVRKKFLSKQKKATQMILPDEEPKCYYDPVTKTYVFEGQQPQAPKQIPKPPSATEKRIRQDVKKQKDDSELSQLTAPPAFKRKSTPAGKGKIKIKQQVQVAKVIDQPVSFAKLIQIINESYNHMLQKVKNGTYERHSQTIANNADTLNQFTSFVEKTIQCSEQINNYENKIIEKWTKILTSQSRELRIMEKVLKQINESAVIYSNLLTKFEQPTKQVLASQQCLEKINKQIIKRDEQIQTEHVQQQIKEVIVKEFVENEFDKKKIQDLELQLSNLTKDIASLKQQQICVQKINDQYKSQKKQIQMFVKVLNSKIQEANKQNIELQQMNRTKQKQVLQIKESSLQSQSNYLQQISQLKDKLSREIEQSSQVTKYQQLYHQLEQVKINLQQELKKQKAKNKQNKDELTAEILKQKYKIEEQLKFTEQKERQYLRALKNMQQHQNIIQQYDASLDHQSELLRTILKTRLQANKNPENDIPASNKIQFDSSSISIVLQLSDIVSLVTQTNLDRLQSFNSNYCKLHQKYIESKNLLKKIKNNTANQSLILNRSVAKLRTLIESYKIDKQQAEERCSQMQLQYDKLKKKLSHYREEDQFNKSYLSKIKPSNINSQDQSFLSLQEDKQQLTTEIDVLHKEIQVKNETLKKNQNDLEDLLINYEKNQQKLLELEKKFKLSQKQSKNNKQSCDKLENKIKLLELKLQNQKERYDQIQNRQQSRIKNLQTSFDKRLKLLQVELDQSQVRENNLKLEMEQINKQCKNRVATLQQNYHNIQNQLRSAIKLKMDENGELLTLLQEANQRLQLEKEQKIGLNQRNIHLMHTQTQLNKKLNDIIDEHLKQISIHRESQQNLNNIISTLLQRYQSFKQEQQLFKEQYDFRLNQLQHELEASHHQSIELLNQINQYSNHIKNLNSVIEEISVRYAQEKEINENAFKQSLIENEKLRANLSSFNTKNEELKLQNAHLNSKSEKLMVQHLHLKTQFDEQEKQIKQFEEIIQKMSQQMARHSSDREQLCRDKTDLQEKLMFKDRQIETLTNQINKKSQELMVKTQELLQKDQIMLEHQQLSVTKKQQFDELKNQLENSQKLIIAKDELIRNFEQEMKRRVKQVIDDNTQESKNKQIQIDNLKQILLLANKSLQEQHENNVKMKQRIEQLTKQLAADNETINSQNSKFNQIQSQIQEKRLLIISHQQLIQSLKLEISQKTSTIQELSKTISSLNDEISSISIQLQYQKNKHESAQSQIEALKLESSSKITDFQRKLSDKQCQLAQISQQMAQEKQKDESKEIQQNDEIEGQMEYLLKEIQSRQNQVERLKAELKISDNQVVEISKQKEQLQQLVQNMNEKLQQKTKLALQLQQLIENTNEYNKKLSIQNDDLKTQIKKITESNRFLELDILTLTGKKHQLQVTVRQQIISIQDLSRQLENQRVNQSEYQKLSINFVKQESSIVQDLIADLQEKDEAIIEKQREIESEEHLIQELENDKNIKQEQIRNNQRIISEKLKIIAEFQISVQQKIRIIEQKSAIILQQQTKIEQLIKNVAQLSQIIQNQQKLIEQKNQTSTLAISTDENENLKQQLQAKRIENEELTNNLIIKINEFNDKQAQYAKKIAFLEQKVNKMEISPQNKVLEENYKALLDENTALMNEKVQLMKSNNYLVSINQKLVGEKSSSNMRQLHKSQSHIVSSSNSKPNQLKDRSVSQITEAKSEQPKGFFGALSSLFLTQTQTERLRK